MKMPSPIVAGSIAIAVFAGGFAVGHFVTDDSGSSSKASGKPQVLGQVFAKNPDTSTSTTAATLAPVSPPATQAPSSATTVATGQPSAGSPAATATVTQTQTTSPPATTTVVITNTDCGSGTASAVVSATTFPRSRTANTDYETDATVDVHNGVDRPIQIDSLAIRLTYEDGGTQDVVFNNAAGTVVQPGGTAEYKVAVNTGQRQVRSDGVAMQSFAFHTAGHPECAGRNS